MAYRRGDRIVRFTRRYWPFVLLFCLTLVFVRAMDWLVFGLRVRGREHLRGVDRAVLVSNHTLLMDPAVIAHAIRPRRTYYTMLEETALIPFLGTYVRLLGTLPIPDSSASMRMLEHGFSTALSELGFVHFFPEGELYRWNQGLRPFRPGAFVIAARLQVPVVPLTIVLKKRSVAGRSSFKLLGRKVRIPPRVLVVIGKPLIVSAPADAADPVPSRLETARHRTTGAGAAVLQAERRTQPGGRGSLRSTATRFAETVRQQMQGVIDRNHGSRALYRGPMPRLAGGVRHTIPAR